MAQPSPPAFCAPCQRTFRSASALTDHLKSPRHASTFICKTCNTCLPDQLQLDQHYTVTGHDPAHQPPPPRFSCEACNRQFKDQSALDSHMRSSVHLPRPTHMPRAASLPTMPRHHGFGDIFEGFGFDEIPEFPPWESPGVRLCSLPGSARRPPPRRPPRAGLNPHLKSAKHVICNRCNTSHATPAALATHLATVHGPEFICEACGEDYIDQYALEQHFQSAGHVICDICGTGQTTPAALATHRAAVHAPQFVCAVCGEDYIDQYALDQHVLTTTREVSLVCVACDTRFTGAEQMARHMASSLHTK